jgi:GNAT superfamily N-acetyltransferase
VAVAIRQARPDEIDAIVAVDDDACTLDAEAGLVIAFPPAHPYAVEERACWTRAIDDARLDVAVDDAGVLVAFAARRFVDGEPYLDQLSVVRAWMRRGIGTRLASDAIAWAGRQPAGRLWLTTYAHLPWNRPFYERLGFTVVDDARCAPELQAILREQREILPAPEQRVAMRWTRNAARVTGGTNLCVRRSRWRESSIVRCSMARRRDERRRGCARGGRRRPHVCSCAHFGR